MRGTMRHRSNASRFARAVPPEPADPATYQNGLGSSLARAASSRSPGTVVNAGSSPPMPRR